MFGGLQMNRKVFGRKLNTARKDLGMTGEQLAEICGLSPVYLRQMETGMKIPSLPVFISLCKNLKVSPSYLLLEAFDDSYVQEMDFLFDLWNHATPKQLKIISTMLKNVLETMDEWEQQEASL